jgi:ABC-type nitrate/sulfonate/bicarbonate transport system permease component
MGPLKKVLLALGLPIVLVVTWWTVTSSSTSFFWPPLRDILGTMKETWFPDRLAQDVLPSLLRLGTGYLLAVVLGVGLGVPILILFAGIGNGMKVLVIVSGCIWPVLLNTVEGVRGLDEVLRDTSTVYRLTRLGRLRHLVLRGASPQIFAGARQSLSIGIILMVISEMFAASNGIGFTIVQFQRTFAIPQMWSGIILLGLIGVLLALVFRAVEGRALRWYIGLRAAQRGE